MPWKCSRCGMDNDDRDLRCGGGCGGVHAETCCRLTTDHGSITIHLPTRIGRHALRRLTAEPLSTVSQQQFGIALEPESGGWVLRHLATAARVTRRNGEIVPVAGVLLQNGDQITVDRITVTVALGNH